MLKVNINYLKNKMKNILSEYEIAIEEQDFTTMSFELAKHDLDSLMAIFEIYSLIQFVTKIFERDELSIILKRVDKIYEYKGNNKIY